MTAIFLPFASGSVELSFLSSTIERPAACRAASTASGFSWAASGSPAGA